MQRKLLELNTLTYKSLERKEVMKLFNPIIQLMNRLKYGQKFALIGGLIAIYVAYLVTSTISDSNNNLKRIDMRQQGMTYNLLLNDLLKDIQMHRSLILQMGKGEEDLQSKLDAVNADVDEKMEKITAFDKKAKQLHATENWERLKERWENISSSVHEQNYGEIMVEVYNAYINDIINFMNKIGDSSDLFLNDNKVGNYLVENVVVTMPSLSEKLGQMSVIGQNITNREKIYNQERDQLIKLISDSQKSINDMKYSLEVIAEEDPYFENVLEEFNTISSDIVQHFFYISVNLIDGSTIVINTDDFLKYSSSTIDHAFLMYETLSNELKKTMNNEVKDLQTGRIILYASTALVIIFIVYLCTGFYLSIKHVVNQLKRITKDIAEGDLTTNISFHTRDEMRDVENAFNEMIKGLRNLVQKIATNAKEAAAASEELNANAEQTSISAEQVAKAVQQVASGAENQTNSINESVHSLEETALGIQRIAENSNTVSDLAQHTRNQAEDGEAAVSQTLDQMNAINEAVELSNASIKELHEHSLQIGSILDAILGIADQTNLLALNAAIEAARAGEHGKGFAVVADEVRKLAEQTQQSTKQIGEIITKIQQGTKRSVDGMVTVTENVTSGFEMTKETAAKFAEILIGMKDITPQIEEISATVQEISAGTQQVVATVSEVANISSENAATSEEVAASSEQQLAAMEEISSSSRNLSKMSEELQAVIKMFRV